MSNINDERYLDSLVLNPNLHGKLQFPNFVNIYIYTYILYKFNFVSWM